MIVAGEDVRDAEHGEARRGARPRRVERDRSRAAGNDHRSTLSAGRHIAQGEFQNITELRSGGRADGELRARRADRIGDSGIHVALVDVDFRPSLERLDHMPCGLLVGLERTIGRQGQPPRRVRGNQRPAIFKERDVLLERGERSLDCGCRAVDVDLDASNRKPDLLEQIEGRADDELRLARFDLDERVDDRVKLEFVRTHDLRGYGGAGEQTPGHESQTATFHLTPRCRRLEPAAQ